MELSKLSNILKNNDIVLAIGLVVIVCMMVIPLPAPLLDILLTINSTKLSKDQAANYLNYSVSNFNKMLYLDKIPKGRKQVLHKGLKHQKRS